MKHATLSVGLPNYNHARYLPTALDALLAQTYSVEEIIVIDDASTDDSVKIVQGYACLHPRIRLIIHERNRGVTETLTELLELASGDYFFAPAADDFILPGLFEKSMDLLGRHPHAGLCSAQSRIIDENGVHEGIDAKNPRTGDREGYYLAPADCASVFWKQRSWILGNTAVYRRRALRDGGGYRKELGAHSDAFVGQVIARAHGVCFIPEVLGAMRRTTSAYTSRSNRDPALMREIRDTARDLMLGEYRHLFSPAYVRRWERRWDFGRVRSYSAYKAREWRTGMRNLSSTGKWHERALCIFGATVITVLFAAVQALALVLLLWFDLGRVIRHDLWQAIRHRRRGLLV